MVSLSYNSACELMASINKSGYSESIFAEKPAVYCSATDGTDGSSPIIMEQRFVRKLNATLLYVLMLVRIKCLSQVFPAVEFRSTDGGLQFALYCII